MFTCEEIYYLNHYSKNFFNFNYFPYACRQKPDLQQNGQLEQKQEIYV